MSLSSPDFRFHRCPLSAVPGHDGGCSWRISDTPEVKDPRKPVQCFGPEASAYTHSVMTPGRRVALETDVETRDKYGRLLAYVYVDGRRYDDELLRLGYARLLVIPPNDAHARSLLRAELDARHSQRGQWAVCGDR